MPPPNASILSAKLPIDRRVELLRDAINTGGLVALPTDSAWAIVADPFQPLAVKELHALRRALRRPSSDDASESESTPLSLLCATWKEAQPYVEVIGPKRAVVERLMPGPCTVVLPATRQVPRLLQSARSEVGIRVPTTALTRAVIAAVGNPLLTTTARTLSGRLASGAREIAEACEAAGHPLRIAPACDGSSGPPQESTVIDMTGDEPRTIRAGRGTPPNGTGELSL